MAQKFYFATLVHLLIKGFGHDVQVSNLRSVELPPLHVGLGVESVSGPPVLLGVEGEQMIGAATIGCVLQLVCTSFAPLPGLLEVVSETIESAWCASQLEAGVSPQS
jgi:hypothetical protein